MHKCRNGRMPERGHAVVPLGDGELVLKIVVDTDNHLHNDVIGLEWRSPVTQNNSE